MTEKAILVLLVSLGFAAACAAGPGEQSRDLAPGDPAPAFKLRGSDGKDHSLSEYAGTTVVLAWFPKAFTGG